MAYATTDGATRTGEREDILERCDREYQRCQRVWQPVWDAIWEERRFYEGQHLFFPTDPHERNRQEVALITQDTFDVVRHKAAKLTDAPFLIEPRPVDRISDPDDAERAGQVLQWETTNPQKMFDDCCDLMAVSAIAARIGAIFMDWDPECGPWGEILFRPVDHARAAWEPGYHDPHDLGCGYWFEDRYLPLSWLKSNKKLDQKVVAQLNAEARPSDDGDDYIEVGPDEGDDGVLTRWWWYKNDRTVKERPAKGDSMEPLDEGDRYMTCANPNGNGCGWASLPQDMADPELGREAGDPLPDSMMGSCPRCGADLWRVDLKRTVQDVLLYPKGRRLVIEAPNQRGVGKPLYDGGWPVKNLRSFPLYLLTDYLPADPRKPCGPSDTSLNWSMQVATDLLLTKSFLALDAHQRYFALPSGGVKDWKGKRFEFRDDQFNVMYYDMDQFNGPPSINAFEGSALDQAVPAFFNMLRGTMTARQGVADFGLTESNSKDIPATTVLQLGRMGELPVEHLRRRYFRALARGHGVLWDMIRNTYPAARMARLKLPDGVDGVEWLRGDDLPNFDFVISASPTFDGLEKSKSEALMTLIQVPEEWQELVAEVNGLPPSLLRKVQQKRKELQETQATGALTAPPGKAGVGGQVGLPGDAAPPNGNGNPSSLARMLMEGMREGAMVPGE